MLFVRKPTTVVVEDPVADRLAEERGEVSGMAATLGIMAVVAAFLLVGYFVWWAPVNSAVAVPAPVVQHDTQIIDRQVPGPSTTIVSPPTSTPPQVIEHHDQVIVPVPTPSNSGSNNNNSGSGTNNSGSGANSGGSTTGTDSGSTG